MKITIQHPAGLDVSFEGDVPEFERFLELLNSLPELFGALSATPAADPAVRLGADGHAAPAIAGQINVQWLAQTLSRVGATTDIERVTVMAYAAKEAGLGGIDYALAERLYDELGQPKPGKIRATFSNAKIRGYVQNVGSGVWLTTVPGDNFARYGQRQLRRGQTGSSTNGGGESD